MRLESNLASCSGVEGGDKAPPNSEGSPRSRGPSRANTYEERLSQSRSLTVTYYGLAAGELGALSKKELSLFPASPSLTGNLDPNNTFSSEPERQAGSQPSPLDIRDIVEDSTAQTRVPLGLFNPKSLQTNGELAHIRNIVEDSTAQTRVPLGLFNPKSLQTNGVLARMHSPRGDEVQQQERRNRSAHKLSAGGFSGWKLSTRNPYSGAGPSQSASGSSPTSATSAQRHKPRPSTAPHAPGWDPRASYPPASAASQHELFHLQKEDLAQVSAAMSPRSRFRQYVSDSKLSQSFHLASALTAPPATSSPATGAAGPTAADAPSAVPHMRPAVPLLALKRASSNLSPSPRSGGRAEGVANSLTHHPPSHHQPAQPTRLPQSESSNSQVNRQSQLFITDGPGETAAPTPADDRGLNPAPGQGQLDQQDPESPRDQQDLPRDDLAPVPSVEAVPESGLVADQTASHTDVDPGENEGLVRRPSPRKVVVNVGQVDGGEGGSAFFVTETVVE
eukprot:gene7152-259_t